MEIEVTKRTRIEWVISTEEDGKRYDSCFASQREAEQYCDYLDYKGWDFKLMLRLSS